MQSVCVLKGVDEQPVVHPARTFFVLDNMHLGLSVEAGNVLQEQEKNPETQAALGVDARAILLCVEQLLPG